MEDSPSKNLEGFQTFLAFCKKVLIEDSKPVALTKLIRKRYKECDEDFTQSGEFYNLLTSFHDKMLNDRSNFSMYLKQFLDELKSRKCISTCNDPFRNIDTENTSGSDLDPPTKKLLKVNGEKQRSDTVDKNNTKDEYSEGKRTRVLDEKDEVKKNDSSDENSEVERNSVQDENGSVEKHNFSGEKREAESVLDDTGVDQSLSSDKGDGDDSRTVNGLNEKDYLDTTLEGHGVQKYIDTTVEIESLSDSNCSTSNIPTVDDLSDNSGPHSKSAQDISESQWLGTFFDKESKISVSNKIDKKRKADSSSAEDSDVEKISQSKSYTDHKRRKPNTSSSSDSDRRKLDTSSSSEDETYRKRFEEKKEKVQKKYKTTVGKISSKKKHDTHVTSGLEAKRKRKWDTSSSSEDENYKKIPGQKKETLQKRYKITTGKSNSKHRSELHTKAYTSPKHLSPRNKSPKRSPNGKGLKKSPIQKSPIIIVTDSESENDLGSTPKKCNEFDTEIKKQYGISSEPRIELVKVKMEFGVLEDKSLPDQCDQTGNPADSNHMGNDNEDSGITDNQTELSNELNRENINELSKDFGSIDGNKTDKPPEENKTIKRIQLITEFLYDTSSDKKTKSSEESDDPELSNDPEIQNVSDAEPEPGEDPDTTQEIVNESSKKESKEKVNDSSKEESKEKDEANTCNDSSKAVKSGKSKMVDDHVEPSTSTSEGTKKGSSKQIIRLEKLLEQIRDKIEEVRGKELDLDDLNSNVSDYLLEDKLQQKFLKVWTKLCELHNSATSTGRPTEKYFRYQGTRYQDVNRKIEKFINKRKVFPDYHDIKTLIIKVNKDKKLHLSSKLIDDLAQEAFLEVGNKLQDRRKKDFALNFGSHKPWHSKDKSDDSSLFSVYNDPALYDTELKKKLDANKKISRTGIQQVVDRYARLQYEVGDGSEGEEEEDEDEEDALPENDEPTKEIDTDVAELLEQDEGLDSEGESKNNDLKFVAPITREKKKEIPPNQKDSQDNKTDYLMELFGLQKTATEPVPEDVKQSVTENVKKVVGEVHVISIDSDEEELESNRFAKAADKYQNDNTTKKVKADNNHPKLVNKTTSVKTTAGQHADTSSAHFKHAKNKHGAVDDPKDLIVIDVDEDEVDYSESYGEYPGNEDQYHENEGQYPANEQYDQYYDTNYDQCPENGYNDQYYQDGSYEQYHEYDRYGQYKENDSYAKYHEYPDVNDDCAEIVDLEADDISEIYEADQTPLNIRISSPRHITEDDHLEITNYNESGNSSIKYSENAIENMDTERTVRSKQSKAVKEISQSSPASCIEIDLDEECLSGSSDVEDQSKTGSYECSVQKVTGNNVEVIHVEEQISNNSVNIEQTQERPSVNPTSVKYRLKASCEVENGEVVHDDAELEEGEVIPSDSEIEEGEIIPSDSEIEEGETSPNDSEVEDHVTDDCSSNTTIKNPQKIDKVKTTSTSDIVNSSSPFSHDGTDGGNSLDSESKFIAIPLDLYKGEEAINCDEDKELDEDVLDDEEQICDDECEDIADEDENVCENVMDDDKQVCEDEADEDEHVYEDVVDGDEHVCEDVVDDDKQVCENIADGNKQLCGNVVDEDKQVYEGIVDEDKQICENVVLREQVCKDVADDEHICEDIADEDKQECEDVADEDVCKDVVDGDEAVCEDVDDHRKSDYVKCDKKYDSKGIRQDLIEDDTVSGNEDFVDKYDHVNTASDRDVGLHNLNKITAESITSDSDSESLIAESMPKSIANRTDSLDSCLSVVKLEDLHVKDNENNQYESIPDIFDDVYEGSDADVKANDVCNDKDIEDIDNDSSSQCSESILSPSLTATGRKESDVNLESVTDDTSDIASSKHYTKRTEIDKSLHEIELESSPVIICDDSSSDTNDFGLCETRNEDRETFDKVECDGQKNQFEDSFDASDNEDELSDSDNRTNEHHNEMKGDAIVTSNVEEVTSGSTTVNDKTIRSVDDVMKLKLPHVRNKLIELKKAVKQNVLSGVTNQSVKDSNHCVNSHFIWNKEDEHMDLIERYEEPDSYLMKNGDSVVSSSINNDVIELSDSE